MTIMAGTRQVPGRHRQIRPLSILIGHIKSNGVCCIRHATLDRRSIQRSIQRMNRRDRKKGWLERLDRWKVSTTKPPIVSRNHKRLPTRNRLPVGSVGPTSKRLETMNRMSGTRFVHRTNACNK